MALAVNTGVVKVAPVFNKFPPLGASYHCMDPAPAAFKMVELPEQMLCPVIRGA